MRSFEERKIEIIKVSEKKIKKIKRRKKILYTILPCFVFILCLPYLFAVSQQKNSEDLAPVEDGVSDTDKNSVYVVSLGVSCEDYNFKKYTNCSLIDFLLNIRLTKAKELLVNAKKSVEEIAELCGFSSANYFGLIFKKKEGVSPINYRKIQREKR